MFPLPQIIYTMSSDGLLFQSLGRVHPRFQTPFWGTLLAGTFTGVFAYIFELSQLFSMMSIGTLSAYSIVAACVLILRYKEDTDDEPNSNVQEYTFADVFSHIISYRSKHIPTKLSQDIVTWGTGLYCLLCFGDAGLLSRCEERLGNDEPLVVIPFAIFSICVIVTLIIISVQPKSSMKVSFTVPLVPWLPGISILINIYYRLCSMVLHGFVLSFGYV